LATALSTDLGHDFQSDRYRFMKRTIKVVSELNDANTVEHAFKCLAYLLKHGLNDVHKNFEKYFSLVKPLLESSSVRLQALACQTFARITSQRWKKVKTEKFYEEILNLISKHGLVSMNWGLVECFFLMWNEMHKLIFIFHTEFGRNCYPLLLYHARALGAAHTWCGALTSWSVTCVFLGPPPPCFMEGDNPTSPGQVI